VEGYDDYVIAVTATVEYEIDERPPTTEVVRPKNRAAAPDPAELAWLSSAPIPTIVFEAISSNGVILGTANSIFSAGGGSRVANVTARITLSPEEIQRVKTVSVRWAYGPNERPHRATANRQAP
jgi:hypothetical protein